MLWFFILRLRFGFWVSWWSSSLIFTFWFLIFNELLALFNCIYHSRCSTDRFSGTLFFIRWTSLIFGAFFLTFTYFMSAFRATFFMSALRGTFSFAIILISFVCFSRSRLFRWCYIRMAFFNHCRHIMCLFWFFWTLHMFFTLSCFTFLFHTLLFCRWFFFFLKRTGLRFLWFFCRFRIRSLLNWFPTFMLALSSNAFSFRFRFEEIFRITFS